MTILRADIHRALDDLIVHEEGMRFQSLAVILARERWKDLVATDRKKDLGADAIGNGRVLACSLTATLQKLRSDGLKIKEYFPDATELIFATPIAVSNAKSRDWAKDIFKELGLTLIVMSREDITTSLLSPTHIELCRSQLRMDTVTAAMAPQTEGVLPRQISAPPSVFVGRSRVTNKMIRAIEGGASMCGLHGMGGIGKTALAFMIAKSVGRNFTDAQIYVVLQRENGEVLSARDVMVHVIRSCAPQVQPPAEEALLHGMYRSVLFGKKALLLFDNVRDVQQVENILPPDSCLLLMTSRRRFVLPGLYSRQLRQLSPTSAHVLFCKIASDRTEDPLIDRIVSLCENVPLAVRSIACKLAARPDLSTEELVERLSDARTLLKLTGVEASLTVSYDLLATDLRDRFCILGIFTTSFDCAAAVAVWELDYLQGRDALGDLFAQSLLEYDATQKKYRLHDLVRKFALSKLSHDDEFEARRRHAAYFRDLLRAADDLYRKGGDDAIEGLALADNEWENISTGQQWAALAADASEDAREIANEYPDVGRDYLHFRQHPLERIRWREAALAAAERLGDKVRVGRHRGYLGLAFADLGELGKAKTLYETALLIARETRDRKYEGIWLGCIGMACDRMGDPATAIKDYFPAAIEIAVDCGDRRNEAIWLGNMGQALLGLTNCLRAKECFVQELNIAREIRHPRVEMMALNCLGETVRELGMPKDAIPLHRDSLRIARSIGDRRGEAYALGNLGDDFKLLGRGGKPLEYYRQALAILEETGDKRNEGLALLAISKEYKRLGNRIDARFFARRAWNTWKAIQDPRAEKARLELEDLE